MEKKSSDFACMDSFSYDENQKPEARRRFSNFFCILLKF